MAYTEPLIAAKKCIQAKLEAVKGTAETTGFTDVLVVGDPVIRPDGPFEQRNGPGLYMGRNVTGIIEGRGGTATFQVELRGNGTAAMDAGLSVLLQCCGLKNTTETYQVTSSPANHNTCTIFVFEDGKKKILSGAMGNVNFEGSTGKRILCNFEFKGIYGTPVDEALPAFAPSAEAPPVLSGGTFTIATVAKLISSFGLNMNNEVILRPDVNAASGIAHAAIVNIDPVLTADLEAELVATYDIYGIWLAGTPAAVSLVIGSGAGKAITFTLPAIQYREIPGGEREGLQTYDVTAQCNHSSGDDAVAIAVQTV